MLDVVSQPPTKKHELSPPPSTQITWDSSQLSFAPSSTTKAQKLPVPKFVNFLILFCASTMNIGNYYTFDLPQALATPFKKFYQISPEETQLLYAVYSLPNII